MGPKTHYIFPVVCQYYKCSMPRVTIRGLRGHEHLLSLSGSKQYATLDRGYQQSGKLLPFSYSCAQNHCISVDALLTPEHVEPGSGTTKANPTGTQRCKSMTPMGYHRLAMKNVAMEAKSLFGLLGVLFRTLGMQSTTTLLSARNYHARLKSLGGIHQQFEVRNIQSQNVGIER